MPVKRTCSRREILGSGFAQIIMSSASPRAWSEDLESAYREMARDDARESAASEWVHVTSVDVAEEAE
jgi:hypothetical protein